MKSLFLKLKANDIIKGLIVTVITVILTGSYQFLQAGTFPITWEAWRPVVLASASAGISYILKNFFTNSEDKFMKKESSNETNNA